MKKIGSIAILAASLASLASAQTLVGRTSNLNYAYVYGAGGDSHSGNDTLTDTSVVSSDSETLGFSGSTSGSLSGNPYFASVNGMMDHAYVLFGSVAAFSGLQVEQGTSAETVATGVGLAQFLSGAPGNELVLEFTIGADTNYHLFGFLAIDPQNAGAGNYVALQRWDGIVWQNLYTTFSLSGQQGSIESTGVLTSGLYRTRSVVGVSAFGSETESSTTFYQLEMSSVPEPVTLILLAPALALGARLRRRTN